MPSAENLTDDTRFVGLFVGRSGSGKSAAAYSFPKPMKVYDIDLRIRGGLVPWVEKKGIEYTSFPPKGDEPLFKRLNDEFAMDMIKIRSRQSNIKTFVFDSLTIGAKGLMQDTVDLVSKSERKGHQPQAGIVTAEPGDYKLMYTAIGQILSYLKSIPGANIIVCAHIVNRYKKAAEEYQPAVIAGEQLALPDKLAEIIPGDFDHVLRFEKVDAGNQLKFFFSAQGDLARSTYPIRYGQHDITGLNFYDKLKEYMPKVEAVTL